MGSVVALSLLVATMYVVVLAGGIAYEITGMDRETARFQALSAFTGTGFTTRASEECMQTRTRRRITMALIVVGYAGAASVVATLLSSFDVDSFLQSLGHILAAVALGGLTLTLLRRNRDQLMAKIRRLLRPRLGAGAVWQENLFRSDSDFGVARIEVPENCPLAGRPLGDLALRTHHLTVLTVERADSELAIADGSTQFLEGDLVLLFGRLDQIQKVFAPDTRQVTGPLVENPTG